MALAPEGMGVQQHAMSQRLKPDSFMFFSGTTEVMP
jgi:hypothetical protein